MEGRESLSHKRAFELAQFKIGRREHSRFEIETYLYRKGATEEVVQAVCDELVRLQILSDERFARILIRDQICKKKGPRFILQKLRLKGIHLQLPEVEALYQEFISSENEHEAILHAVRRRYPTYENDFGTFQKALGFVVRRGFSLDRAKAILGKVPKSRYPLD